MSPLCSTLQLTEAEKTTILLEVYKKHATELLAIESSQAQLTALTVSVFGLGASVLASALHEGAHLLREAKIGLTFVVLALMAISALLKLRRDRARKSTRQLLVEVEQALRLYDYGVYFLGRSLYEPMLLNKFPTKGRWLGWVDYLASVCGIGLLFLLWGLGK